jgi:hypothetical protein
MAKFLKGNELNTEIGRIFEGAEKNLILISPYIKLHHRYADELKTRVQDDNLQIIIVFGKNEQDITKSLTASDLEFFKQFPNIEIRYEKRLHAKFYANESAQIITSMNLYDFSQDENIEVGVKTEFSRIGNLASNIIGSEANLDQHAWDYFNRVIENSDRLFQNIPQYEKAMLGLSKKYCGYKTTLDKISEHFAKTVSSKTFASKNTVSAEVQIGYCIRTGEQIPYNIQKPYSEKAYKSWAQYKNPNYKEKYCHKTGKPSDGKTSMANPTL